MDRRTNDDSGIQPVNDESAGLVAITAGEVGQQIAAARRFPRSLDTFRKNSMAWACMDEETAAGCFYSVPRAGQNIEGPSIRMAEILATAWGNLRIRTRLVERTPTHVTVAGECWDLETNAAWSAEEVGRITTAAGKAYSEDMVQTTIKATAAKARRNAILNVIPGSFVKPIMQQVRRTAIGDAATLAQTRKQALDALQKMGANLDRVLHRLGKKSAAEIDHDDILTLRSAFIAVRDGESTVDDAFPAPEEKGPARAQQDAAAGEWLQDPTRQPQAQQAPPEGASTTGEPDRGALVVEFVTLQSRDPDRCAQVMQEFGLGEAMVEDLSTESLFNLVAALRGEG